MGKQNKIDEVLDINNCLRALVGIVFLSVALFSAAFFFEDFYESIIAIISYNTVHSVFEFSSILVSFSIFVVAHYTYQKTGTPRLIILANVFLFMGIVDAFHTLSYKGMPQFFVLNNEADRATTFWIVSRLVGAFGYVLASVMNSELKLKVNKYFLLFSTVFMSIMVFFVETYVPGFFPKMYIEGEGLTDTKIILEYLIIILLAVSAVKFFIEYKKFRDHMSILFVYALVFAIFSELSFTNYISVYGIYNFLGHVYKVISFFVIFKVMFISTVERPYIELYDARSKISAYAENLDRLVEDRTKELKIMNQRFIEDLHYAKDIQKALMPSALPGVPDTSFEAKYFPAERVSGDFYNIFKVDDENIALYIGDVAGHGVPAAMLTVFLTQSINTMRDVIGGEYNITKPSNVLNSIYESFNKTNFKDEIYMVMFYGVYNKKTMKLTYSSAGMNVAPLIIKSSGEIREISIQGFPICKFMGLYNFEYKETSIKLDRGDKILFYTDGLTEAETDGKQRFSEKRLENILKEYHSLSAKELSQIISRNIFNFMGGRDIKDDITYFIMEIGA